uniref:Uncharacterized protein n=1 Tax=Oryza glumipatula TaxID=40148 RepID=A0A0D9Y4Y0_9ORYZ
MWKKKRSDGEGMRGAAKMKGEGKGWSQNRPRPPPTRPPLPEEEERGGGSRRYRIHPRGAVTAVRAPPPPRGEVDRRLHCFTSLRGRALPSLGVANRRVEKTRRRRWGRRRCRRGRGPPPPARSEREGGRGGSAASATKSTNFELQTTLKSHTKAD